MPDETVTSPDTARVMTIYVKLPPDGDKRARTLAFNVPEGVGVDELFSRGMAIDGAQCIVEVDVSTTMRELLRVERELASWLRDELGYTVRFR